MLKLNNTFSAENVNDISVKIHRYGTYTENDFESDVSIHCEPGNSIKKLLNYLSGIINKMMLLKIYLMKVPS